MFKFCVLVQAEEVCVRTCTRKEAVRVCGRPQHASQGKVRRSATHRNPPPVGRPQVLVWQVSDGDKIVTCWCRVSCHCQPHVESGQAVPHPSLHTCLSFWCSHMPWVPPLPPLTHIYSLNTCSPRLWMSFSPQFWQLLVTVHESCPLHWKSWIEWLRLWIMWAQDVKLGWQMFR